MTKKTDKVLMDRLANAARSGDISRRSFMHFAAAAGMTASAATGLWGTSAAAQPSRGGTFRWGVHDGNSSDTHDPGTYVTRQMIFLAHTHRSYLTMITPENGLGPDLATAWEASPDAKVWTFSLNENASFHSGKKCTAQDVVDSLNHHRGEESTSAAKALLSDVTDVRAAGDYTVVITLSRGNADLPWL